MSLIYDERHNCDLPWQAFVCQPPWHFFGWFYATKIPMMAHARKAMHMRGLLRFGERLTTYRGGEPSVDVWLHESVHNLSAYWAYYRGLEKARDDGACLPS